MSERELVQHIVGLPDKYEAIMIALSTNRGIAFVDLRQTLLNFEKKEQDRKSRTELTEFKIRISQDQNPVLSARKLDTYKKIAGLQKIIKGKILENHVQA